MQPIMAVLRWLRFCRLGAKDMAEISRIRRRRENGRTDGKPPSWIAGHALAVYDIRDEAMAPLAARVQ